MRLGNSLTGFRLQHIYKKQLHKAPNRLLKLLLCVYVCNKQLSPVQGSFVESEIVAKEDDGVELQSL